MLIGNQVRKPNLTSVRRIKRSLLETLELPDDAMITVTQLACLEKDCAPIETVIGLLRPGLAQLQHKVHKPTDELNAEDLVCVAAAWGFSVEITSFNTF